MKYNDVIDYLESLTIMPKTMPGLEKIKNAVLEKSWFATLDSKKIITVAGTNGKGTTCAILEALLISEQKNVGLFTSPHLIQTTERVRINGVDISEADFLHLFITNKVIIEKYQLSHFESLTLMAADYFFSQNLDYVIFEVGLGGTYDATNVFPNGYAVITKLGLDHQNILGDSIQEIALNKFGIIKDYSVVIHHKLPNDVEKNINLGLEWIEGSAATAKIRGDRWQIKTNWGTVPMNMVGNRSAENAGAALTLFERLGFNPAEKLQVLNQVRWNGRMQKINWPNIPAPVYLSGDHNVQGVESLIEILQSYQWSQLHLIVGVGQDKSCELMFQKLFELPRSKIYLTETPFKGRRIQDYPDWVLQKSKIQDSSVIKLFSQIKANAEDMIIVTGSLYLVGQILKYKKL
jgi:dihydrofolate synthase/folylpolyglutamate synthase